MINKSRKTEKKNNNVFHVQHHQTDIMNVNSPVFVPHATMNMTWSSSSGPAGLHHVRYPPDHGNSHHRQFYSHYGGVTYYQPMHWVQVRYQINSSDSEEYKRDDTDGSSNCSVTSTGTANHPKNIHEDHPSMKNTKHKKQRCRRPKKMHRSLSIGIDEASKENLQPTKIFTNAIRRQSRNGPFPLSAVNGNCSQEINFKKTERIVRIGLFKFSLSLEQEVQLAKLLHDSYLVKEEDLRKYGYPVENENGEGVEILRSAFPKWNRPQTHWEDCDINGMQISSDSGRGSVSPSSTDSEISEDDRADSNSIFINFVENSTTRKCDRCKKPFIITDNGEYLTQEDCCYHWGRLSSMYIGGSGYTSRYSCCNGSANTDGCTKGKNHVWSGLSTGVNGPFTDFVKTAKKQNSKRQIFALDCEMCYTGCGLDLAKVSIINVSGEIVYEEFVRPKAEIVDYNTRFSGITEADLEKSNVKTLPEVQQDLLELFDADTILIGHGLENDLKALKLMHKKIVDTTILFPHNQGYPYKRKLKHLTMQLLKRDIQNDANGHSSLEDSKACLELALWKVWKDSGFFQETQ